VTHATVREHVLKDTRVDFYICLQQGILPAVSFVRAGGLMNRRPASSKFSTQHDRCAKRAECVKRAVKHSGGRGLAGT
jgi:hypothetical protein